jgi:hypothetical protein
METNENNEERVARIKDESKEKFDTTILYTSEELDDYQFWFKRFHKNKPFSMI